MAVGKFNHVCIRGIAVALPETCYSTEELAGKMDERALKRFIKSTGVKRRYLSCEGQTTSDLCFIAADHMMNTLAVNRNEIDACIFISQNPDFKRPSTAIILQDRLGLEKDCMAFDINLGCSGYVYGLYIAAGLIESGAVKNVLLLTGDVNRDLPGELLFGDGASASLLQYEESSNLIEGLLKSDGSGYKAIYTPVGGQRHPLSEASPDWENIKPQMNGTDVFEFTITQVPKMLEEFNQIFQKSWEDYDYVILHQANLMMLNHIISKLHIPKEKVPISIQDYGNVSSASVPIALADLCEKTGQKPRELSLLLSGFGVGLSWGAVSLTLDTNVVLPIIYTDFVSDTD